MENRISYLTVSLGFQNLVQEHYTPCIMANFFLSNFKYFYQKLCLTLALLEQKVISHCNQYRARESCTSMPSDLACQQQILIFLKLTIDYSKWKGGQHIWVIDFMVIMVVYDKGIFYSVE